MMSRISPLLRISSSQCCYSRFTSISSTRQCHYHHELSPHSIRRRMFSSSRNHGTPSSSSSSSTILQNLAIFAVAGGLGYGAMTLFNNYNDSSGDNDDGPVTPSARITSRVYFDINIQNQPMGRIVIGLYGNETPKTSKNFETLCKGTTLNGRLIG